MNVYNNKEINKDKSLYNDIERLTFGRNDVFDEFWSLVPLDARWDTFNPFAQSTGFFMRFSITSLGLGEYQPSNYNNLYFGGTEQSLDSYPALIDRYAWGFSASRKQYTLNSGSIKDLLQITFLARNINAIVPNQTTNNSNQSYYETINLDYNLFVGYINGSNNLPLVNILLYLHFDLRLKKFTWYINGVEYKIVEKLGDFNWFKNNLNNFTTDAYAITNGIISFRDKKPNVPPNSSSFLFYDYIIQKNHKLTEKNQKQFLSDYSKSIDGESFVNFSFRDNERIGDTYTSVDGFSNLTKEI